jgi:hypothetical protein
MAQPRRPISVAPISSSPTVCGAATIAASEPLQVHALLPTAATRL